MHISTGSYLNSMWAMEDRCIDDAIMNSLVLLYSIKNKFHVAMGLCINRAQKKSKYGSNIGNILGCPTSWHHLQSITEEMHSVMEYSIPTLKFASSYSFSPNPLHPNIIIHYLLLFSVHFLDSNEENL